MTRLEQLKQLVEGFEAVQKKHCKFGAEDTEPDCEFQLQIGRALRYEAWQDLNARQWQLYSDMPGVGLVTKDLNQATKKVFEFIKETHVAPMREIGPYLKDYCWRVTIEV